MDEMLQNLMQRSLDISTQVARQRMPQSSRQDLRKMMGVADDLVRDLSREGVNCRRLRRQTRKFDEIAQQAEQALLNVEQHLLLARLRY